MNISGGQPERTILLVDDSPDDIMLIRLAFKKAGLEARIIEALDGQQAMEYLERVGPDNGSEKFPVPQLVLLDLKMPRVDGFEVLAWLRKHPRWTALPVIVLSTSAYGPDIERAYALGANSFLTKPMDFSETWTALRLMFDFWLPGDKTAQPSGQPR